MSDERIRRRTRTEVVRLLPVLSFLLWTAGVAAGRYAGIWRATGTAALLLLALAMFYDGRRLAGLLRPSIPLILWGVAAALGQIAATYMLYIPAARLLPFLPGEMSKLYALFGSFDLVRTVVLLPLIILSEEVIWRGSVQSTATDRCGPLAGAGLAALLYAAAHVLSGSLLLPLTALGCGLYWSLLRRLTGSLIPPLIAHLGWDFTVLVVLPLPSVVQLLALP